MDIKMAPVRAPFLWGNMKGIKGLGSSSEQGRDELCLESAGYGETEELYAVIVRQRTVHMCGFGFEEGAENGRIFVLIDFFECFVDNVAVDALLLQRHYDFASAPPGEAVFVADECPGKAAVVEKAACCERIYYCLDVAAVNAPCAHFLAQLVLAAFGTRAQFLTADKGFFGCHDFRCGKASWHFY